MSRLAYARATLLAFTVSLALGLCLLWAFLAAYDRHPGWFRW